MLAEKVSNSIARSFRIPSVPTIAVRVTGGSQIAFSHFKNQRPQPGLSIPSAREEAFVLNIPLAPAFFPIVSIDGRRQSVAQKPGKVYLFDLASRNEVSLSASYDSIRIHIPRSALDGFESEEGMSKVAGLRARSFGQHDPVLYNLGLVVLPLIENTIHSTRALLDHIAVVLFDHVVHTYGDIRRKAASRGGLTAGHVRKVSDYVDAYLSDDLSVSALGQECGLSVSQFSRAFRVSMGVTPHQWITQCRVERAKELMMNTSGELADIAIACGFVDQSHLGRQFLAREGVSPGQWRRAFRR
ncbi:AraC family transcriptional regulator [Pararobbsia silviterrae]|nr:AraC family transcriptional regulator [Pararobbsia silviterrae]